MQGMPSKRKKHKENQRKYTYKKSMMVYNKHNTTQLRKDIIK